MLCWEVAWRVSVVCYDLDFFCVIMGFAHPQPNSLQIQSDYGKKTQFHALQKLAKPTVYGLLCQF